MRIFPHLHRARAPENGGLLPGSPDAVEVHGRWVQVGDDHVATLAVTGYPAEVGAGWPEPLLAYPGLLDVTLHIEPVPPAVASERLRKQRGRFESSRRQDASRGRLDDPFLEAAAEDAADLAGRVARGEARLFRLGMYLTVRAPSPEELADRVAEVRALASSMLLDLADVTWRQLQGWITSLPLAFDNLGMRRVFDTDALAASFPFTSPDLPVTAGNTGMGVLFGLNLHSPGVVVWDRWARLNAVISPSGPINLVSLTLPTSPGVEAFVIDPERVPRPRRSGRGTIIRPEPGPDQPPDLSPAMVTTPCRRALFMQPSSPC
jgi:hypothetical protein